MAIPVISQPILSTDVLVQRGPINGNQLTNNTESQTNELHQQIRDLADSLAKQIYLLNDQAVAAIWAVKDGGLESKHVVNRDCCKILDLTEGTSTTTGLRCTENELNELLILLKDKDPAYKTKIRKFSKRQWLLTILDSNPLTPLGKLLREPKVFNYLCQFINAYTGSQQTRPSQSESTPIAQPAHSPQPITASQWQSTKLEDEEDNDFWKQKATQARQRRADLNRKLRRSIASEQAPGNTSKTAALLREILASINSLGEKFNQILEKLGENNIEQIIPPPKKTNQAKKTAPKSESTPRPAPQPIPQPVPQLAPQPVPQLAPQPAPQLAPQDLLNKMQNLLKK